MSDFIRQLTKSLFWDVDRETLDDSRYRRFIIQRVLERGDLNDWRLTCQRYTLATIVEEAQQMRTLEPKALAFIACVGQVSEETFRCYTLKPSMQKHWSC